MPLEKANSLHIIYNIGLQARIMSLTYYKYTTQNLNVSSSNKIKLLIYNGLKNNLKKRPYRCNFFSFLTTNSMILLNENAKWLKI